VLLTGLSTRSAIFASILRIDYLVNMVTTIRLRVPGPVRPLVAEGTIFNAWANREWSKNGGESENLSSHASRCAKGPRSNFPDGGFWRINPDLTAEH